MSTSVVQEAPLITCQHPFGRAFQTNVLGSIPEPSSSMDKGVLYTLLLLLLVCFTVTDSP